MSDKRVEEAGARRAPIRLVADHEDGGRGHTVSRLLGRMRHSAFQGRKLGEAFEAWQRMIDGDGLALRRLPAVKVKGRVAEVEVYALG